MKKFYIFILAVLATAAASAITVKPVQKVAQKTVSAKKALSIKSLPEQAKRAIAANPTKKAPRKETTAIAQPYMLSATYNGWFYDNTCAGLAAGVIASGNDYTITDMFTTATGYDVTIPFTRQDNVLTCDTAEIVGEMDYTEYEMGIVKLHFGELILDEEYNIIGAKPATLNIDADGNITSPSDDIYYGLYQNDEETGEFSAAWAYIYAISMSPVTEDLTEVEIPDGAEPQEYLYTTTQDGETNTTIKSIAYTDGNDFYLYGLTDSWIKGSIKDGLVTFPALQYLGSNTGFYLYFYPATLEYDEETYTYNVTGVDNLVLKLNEDGSLTPTDDVYALTVTIANQAYSYSRVVSITPYAGDVPAIPVDPYFTLATFADETYDSDLQFVVYNVFNQGTNGEYLNTDNMYLSFYYDDDLYEFTPDLYPLDVDEPTTEIPYSQFTSNMYFGSQEQYLYLMDMMFEKLGVQVVYYCNGKRCTSNIVYIDAQNEQTTVDAAGMTDITAINSVKASDNTRYTGIYNLAGQRVNASQHGIYIKDGKKYLR